MKIPHLLRQKTIIEQLEQGKYPNLEELTAAVNDMLLKLNIITGTDLNEVSERTIKRDIKEIKDILGIEVKYQKSNKGYFIESRFNNNECDALLETAQLVYLLQNMKQTAPYIAFEPRKAKTGTEYFFEVLNAIHKKKKVSFSYFHYEKKVNTLRIVSPLGLKEFKGFWYLVAKDDKGFKTFGLDRISALTISHENADYPKDFNLEKHYEHCYGIVRFPDVEPEEIHIWANPVKAGYYKANPLHKSQKLIEETKDYTIFAIYVCLTYDLQQELLSHGKENVRIIKPENGMEIKRYY